MPATQSASQKCAVGVTYVQLNGRQQFECKCKYADSCKGRLPTNVKKKITGNDQTGDVDLSYVVPYGLSRTLTASPFTTCRKTVNAFMPICRHIQKTAAKKCAYKGEFKRKSW